MDHDFFLASLARDTIERAGAGRSPASKHVTGPGSMPHLTLTQCALRDAPRERLREYVARLADQLRGRPVPLDAVVAFGAGFLFWCAEPAGPARRALQSAHELAVTLAEGFLDPAATSRWASIPGSAIDRPGPGWPAAVTP